MRKFFSIIAAIGVAGIIGCNDDDDGNSSSEFDALKTSAVSEYSEVVYATYTDAYTDAQDLKVAITAFVSDPSATSLEEAKQAWLNSRETYGQTEAFRFYGGPIDDEDGPEGQLNAWPLDESYIDYVDGDTNGGEPSDGTNIINSVEEFPVISEEVLAGLNEKGGETNISTGYHAIEFLLWGQDLSEDGTPGQRPYTDYVIGSAGTGGNQERRATYLTAVTDLLVSDLESVRVQWQSGATYRTTFEASVDQSLEDIISALGKLSTGELAGERMFVPYDLQSKEDEHSCFSDNTTRDIVNNALGIQNVFLGKYKLVEGTSIYDVIAEQDQDLADEIKTLMEESVAACEAIQAPFDQEFLDEQGRVRIITAINLLRDQGDKLAEAAQVLGFEFDPSDV